MGSEAVWLNRAGAVGISQRQTDPEERSKESWKQSVDLCFLLKSSLTFSEPVSQKLHAHMWDHCHAAEFLRAAVSHQICCPVIPSSFLLFATPAAEKEHFCLYFYWQFDTALKSHTILTANFAHVNWDSLHLACNVSSHLNVLLASFPIFFSWTASNETEILRKRDPNVSPLKDFSEPANIQNLIYISPQ